MSIATTCIGAYPKPDYVEIGNFAETGAPDDGQTRAFSYTQDSSVQQVSIEDAHCLNDLLLLEDFDNTAIILGVVTIASSRIESIDDIEQRLRLALQHIDSSRLLAAPDCGLMMLGRELAMAKLHNMCAAAARI
jgi:methionine synthase II (cobalamin-independent)